MARWLAAGAALWPVLALGAGPDPVKDAKNPQLATSDRVRAVERAWAAEKSHEARREDLKSIFWINANGTGVRRRCLELLYEDPADTDHADTRAMLRLMLPTEGDFGLINDICRIIERERWPDLAGPLIRSWARPVPIRDDDERYERRALLVLAGSTPLNQFIFELFVQPPEGEGTVRDRNEKARAAAWELLGRLDKDGSQRTAMMNAGVAANSTDPLHLAIRACAIDLRAVPLTASQLDWAKRLHEDAPRARAWWRQATAAIATVPAANLEAFRMRHAEPVRWASVHHPQWLTADRQTLLAELTGRLHGRTVHPRTTNDSSGEAISERLVDWEGRMSWGDLLSVLVIDEAIRTPELARTLWGYVERDIKDPTTELGGLLDADDNGVFHAVLYPPRGAARRGDRQFVASDEMQAAGAQALAHYHFHAQRIENADYAGPGPGDMEYAQDQGRNCIVFTPIREGVLDVDYYQAGGIRIDLGVLRLSGR